MAINFEFNGTIYQTNEKGNYYYKSTGKEDKKGNPIMMRVPAHVFEQAFDEYTKTKTEDAKVDQWQEEADAELAERQRKAAESDKAAEDAMNKCGDGTPLNEVGKQIFEQAKKKAKKVRKSKDIMYTHKTGLTLTTKQVEFIMHIPDTSFYENGLDSTMWCDVLADEIGGQFTGKPMTVGAMISTLREKDLIYVGLDKIGGKKCKFFGFTELGKEIAQDLGLK